MFGRPKPPTQSPTDSDPAAHGKGRPTPSRKEAELQRKATLKGTSASKSGKGGKAADREQARAEREHARARAAAGDQRYMQPRDRGPARAMTRDFVDGRIAVAEFFIFFAIGVLLLGFVHNQKLSALSSIAFLAVIVILVFDVGVMLLSLSRKAKAEFPDAADRKGLMMYAALRSLQLRRLRLPAPRVKRNGQPRT